MITGDLVIFVRKTYLGYVLVHQVRDNSIEIAKVTEMLASHVKLLLVMLQECQLRIW